MATHSSILTWRIPWREEPGGLQSMGSQRVRHDLTIVVEASTRETKHHTRRVGELRFITPAGPEELTRQALSPEQRGYRVFIHAQA